MGLLGKIIRAFKYFNKIEELEDSIKRKEKWLADDEQRKTQHTTYLIGLEDDIREAEKKLSLIGEKSDFLDDYDAFKRVMKRIIS